MSNKGLGDIVEAAIKRTTFGRVRPKKGCGCEKRKQWLNEKGNNALAAINKIQNGKIK
jgi:hypothetical protein